MDQIWPKGLFSVQNKKKIEPHHQIQQIQFSLAAKSHLKHKLCLFWPNFPKKEENIFQSILKFFPYHEIHLLKKSTKSLVDDGQLPEYFNVSSPVGGSDNNIQLIEYKSARILKTKFFVQNEW